MYDPNEAEIERLYKQIHVYRAFLLVLLSELTRSKTGGTYEGMAREYGLPYTGQDSLEHSWGKVPKGLLGQVLDFDPD